jgi:hypothetical protein
MLCANGGVQVSLSILLLSSRKFAFQLLAGTSTSCCLHKSIHFGQKSFKIANSGDQCVRDSQRAEAVGLVWWCLASFELDSVLFASSNHPSLHATQQDEQL